MKSLTLVTLLTAVLLTAPALAAQSGGAGPAPGGGVNAKNGEICASTYNALLNAEAEADNRAGTKAAGKWSKLADSFWRDGEVLGCGWAA